MQRFKFPLQSVLEYRQLQLDLERARINELLGALTSLEDERERLRAHLAAEEQSTKYQGAVEPLELLALDAFARSAANQQDRIGRRRRELMATLDQQKQKVVEAQRNYDLLEKLHDRRRSSWRHAESKELDDLASDAFLARRPAAGPEVEPTSNEEP